jgi:hypothetical protein
VAERTSDPTFADTGWADDQHIELALDPVAGDEAGEQRSVEPARCRQIDILDDGEVSQPGEFQPGGEALVLPFDDLAIDHQGETILERQGGDVGLAALLVEGLGHAGQAEGDEAIEGGMSKHGGTFRQW